MKKYQSYKDSGVELIGKIPGHWEVCKMKFFVDLRGRIGWRNLRTDDYVDEGPILLGVRNISSDGNVDLTEVTRIPQAKFEESPEIIVQKDDLLLAKTGATIGKSCLVEKVDEPMTVNAAVNIMRPMKNVLPSFLQYVVASNIIQEQMFLNIAHSAQGNLFQKDISDIISPFPCISEQTAISIFLDTATARLDRFIALRQQQIDLLKEQRASLIQQAVTKGIRPGVKMKDSGVEWIGEVPEDWIIHRMKFLLSEKMKYGANESAEFEDLSEPRYIRITDFDDSGKLREETFKSLPYTIAKDYLLQEGDILFARSGATVGKTFQFKNYEGKACYAGYLIKAKPNPKKVLSDYLYAFTRTGLYENWKSSIFIQNTIQNISAEKYNELLIPTPTIEEQSEIIKFIESETAELDTLRQKYERQIELMKEYRASLIAAAVTGKIDVRKN